MSKINVKRQLQFQYQFQKAIAMSIGNMMNCSF